MAKPKMQTITRKDWDKKHKDFKLIGKDKIPYIMVYDNGTKLIPVKIIEGEMEESVASAIDQIRQDSKDIRDFLKKVFSDSDFRAMKNDKDFVQYLKSIYEGVSVNERNSSVNKRRAGAELKQKLKGKRSDGMGKYTATIYGLDSKGKRVELKSLNDLNKYSKFELDESVVNENDSYSITDDKGRPFLLIVGEEPKDSKGKSEYKKDGFHISSQKGFKGLITAYFKDEKTLKKNIDKKYHNQLGESVNEAKAGEIQIYHKSYTLAIEDAKRYAYLKGYTIADDEMFNKVGMNSKRPSVGKTTKVNLELLKNDKPQKKMLHIQVYGMKNSYELNAYIN